MKDKHILIIFYILLVLGSVVSIKAEYYGHDLTVELIKKHEGYRKHTYKDVTTKSIGYGINLKYGLTKEEAELLLRHRLKIVYRELVRYDWFLKLPYTKQNVLINMGYNMGITKLLKFKKMIKALKVLDFKKAGYEMYKSKWYNQTGYRAKELVKIIKI